MDAVCCYDAAAMVPPIWLDELGQPRPKQPCPQCGRVIPVMTVPPDLLGWQPFQVWSVVEWCGHRVEGIPVPDDDGRWRLIVAVVASSAILALLPTRSEMSALSPQGRQSRHRDRPAFQHD